MGIFEKSSEYPVSQHELCTWHKRPGALQRLTPPWEHVTVDHTDGNLNPGSEVHLRLHKGPFWLKWVARHTDFKPPYYFRDQQIKGPFKRWDHLHRFDAVDATTSRLTDHIDFQLPLGIPDRFATPEIERMFAYRHRVLAADLDMVNALPFTPMHIGITGASGLVGSALTAFLSTAGHRVTQLERINGLEWQMPTSPMDAVVHLAGENIGSGRWTAAKKRRIENSRIQGTQNLVQELKRLPQPPPLLISTSAIGYYGTGPNPPRTEGSEPGDDFLAQVCQQWEAQAHSYTAGRVVTPRFGIVLTPAGGALAQMLLPFKLGLGGRIGSGQQMMSWILLDDLIYALYRLLMTPDVEGPVNLTAPKAVTNQEFTTTLGRVLSRPTIFPVPAFGARLAFGEMADALLLSSCDAKPGVLKSIGHQWRYPDLETGLRHVLGRV